MVQPLLEYWLAAARGRNASITKLRAETGATAKYYLEENLILGSLASGRESEAVALLIGLVKRNEPRMAPVRILAARHFWANNDPATAMEILKSQSAEPERKLLHQIQSGQKKGVAQKVSAAIGEGADGEPAVVFRPEGGAS